MTELQAQLLVDCKNNLGEGVQWSVPDQRVYWTDINWNKLYSCDEDGGDVVIVETPERLGSFAFDPKGKILAAFETGLFRFDPVTGQADRLSTFEPDIENTRLNDGRCDRDGRFICGGYNETTADRITSVHSYDGDEVRTIIEDIKCTNSICFSNDGTRMFFTDTPTKKIYAYDYNRSTGELGKRSLFATLNDDEGMPDGSCVDAEDGLWNAQYRGSRVQRFLPDGSRDIVVRLPVSSVTCACFGGKNLDRLFITSANQKLTEEQLEQQPTAGGLFYIDPGVKGREEDRFGTVLFS
ncbi:MAG: SMP-30/gluconolactonase/LRE family protein [Rhodospirillales bacterium]|nr:SMP-30/gluconolactonase/LRE family protein [Rhodospirillales bacterium]